MGRFRIISRSASTGATATIQRGRARRARRRPRSATCQRIDAPPVRAPHSGHARAARRCSNQRPTPQAVRRAAHSGEQRAHAATADGRGRGRRAPLSRLPAVARAHVCAFGGRSSPPAAPSTAVCMHESGGRPTAARSTFSSMHRCLASALTTGTPAGYSGALVR